MWIEIWKLEQAFYGPYAILIFFIKIRDQINNNNNNNNNNNENKRHQLSCDVALASSQTEAQRYEMC